MHVAAILASRFSVLDVLTECRGDVEDQVRRYGLTQSYASHRALGIPVLELHNDHEHTLAALEREARAASDDDGAGALVLGCTGLADFADSLAQRLRAYGCRSLIIEPLRTTLGVARALLDGGLARPQSTAEQR
jgi:allantoin racemase